MNQIKNKNAILLPSDLERQKIFYLIKKVSSVTAWRRIFEFYKIWAAVAENSLRLANERGWESKTAIDNSHYVLMFIISQINKYSCPAL